MRLRTSFLVLALAGCGRGGVAKPDGAAGPDAATSEVGPDATPDALDAEIDAANALDVAETSDVAAEDAATDGGSLGVVTGPFTEYAVPTPLGGPWGITASSDSNIWFTELQGNKIGRLARDGAITEYAVPTPASGPFGITSGPDGSLWFTEEQGNKIGRLTPAGVLTELPIPTPNAHPEGITRGPDGVWFAETDANKIGRITLDGVITEFPIPTPSSYPSCIVTGPDGHLWFTEYFGKVANITVAGTITEYVLPTPGSGPVGIAVGPDGNLWFAEGAAHQIGRSTPTGMIVDFPISPVLASPVSIVARPVDQTLWFTEQMGNQLVRLTTTGGTKSYPIPTERSSRSGEMVASGSPRTSATRSAASSPSSRGVLRREARVRTSPYFGVRAFPRARSDPGLPACSRNRNKRRPRSNRPATSCCVRRPRPRPCFVVPRRRAARRARCRSTSCESASRPT
jgi:virginiamycin B lyase